MIRGGVRRSIKVYFGIVESQKRGSLHLYLLIWLDHNMKPSDFEENIQDVNFRERLRAYFEDTIQEDLDDFQEKHAFENLNSTKLSSPNIYMKNAGNAQTFFQIRRHISG